MVTAIRLDTLGAPRGRFRWNSCLTVDYAQIARAGLDVPFEVTVTHAGGFDKDVVLAMTGDYFKIFEHLRRLHPVVESARSLR